MRVMNANRWHFVLYLVLSFSWLFIQITGKAERLPIKTYTTADGLARDHVNRIVPDSRGFLWFCTSEGLSRFDGYRFTNYGVEQGLPDRVVNDLIETANGIYLVATNAGLCQFDPQAIRRANLLTDTHPSSFMLLPNEQLPSRDVEVLLEDKAGRIWCGTMNGLYRLEQTQKQWHFISVDLSPAPMMQGSRRVRALVEDPQGGLWIGLESGLYHLQADGHVVLALKGLPVENTPVVALAAEGATTIWMGMQFGLYQFRFDPHTQQVVTAQKYTTKDGLADDWVQGLWMASDGRLRVASAKGLSEWVGGGAKPFRSYNATNGLSDPAIRPLAEDHDGNLWLGSENGGAMKLTLKGFTTYDQQDGLGSTRIASLLLNQKQELCAMTGQSSFSLFLNRFANGQFRPLSVPTPQHIPLTWGWYQSLFQDHAGEWWLPTQQGLVRYPKLDRPEQLLSASPKAIYTTREGLTTNEIFRLYEDTRGDIWIGTLGQPTAALTRWERATSTFHRYLSGQELPGTFATAPSAFAEDAAGNIWIGGYAGNLLRYRDEHFTLFGNADGLPSGFIRALYLDRAKRLWVATADGGAARIDEPNAEHPRFVVYNTASGLASNHATCITEDQWGRIYIGTGRGVDRLEVITGRIKHYTTADGLASNFINVALRDHEGALWFGTLQGLSRLLPQPEQASSSPPALISGLRVAGIPYPVSEVGETQITLPELSANQNQLNIDFLGLGLAAGEVMHYQFRLEGTNNDWSDPTEQRSVSYPNLPAGTYRFLVRALNAEGAMSTTPASVSFRILPPLWRRWWFLTGVALFVLTPLLTFARYRTLRLRELSAALNKSQKLSAELTEQDAALREVNQTLELEYAITHLLTEAATPMEAAPRILEAICVSAGWDLGALWDVGAPGGEMHCVAIWHSSGAAAADFEELSRQRVFRLGEGLPGRVLLTKQPLWISDITVDENFPRAAVALQEGLRSGFGFPILLHNEVIGIIEFFSRTRRSPETEQVKRLSSIGNHIGRLIERKRAAAALRESEIRFRTLAETASDAIITIDGKGMIVFVNPAVEKVFGYAASEMLGQDMTMLMPEYLRHLHHAGLARYQRTGQRHVSWEAIELPGLHREGQEIPLEISFGEFEVQGQRYFTGVARDITERKRAAEALQRSREERLAELERVRQRIATDLHDDIGSSLTQISILSEVMQQRIGQENAAVNEPLQMIAGASRELVDAMSDIVWAINPQKDHLSDLTQRMRRFAADSLTARNIRFRLQLPETDAEMKMGANLRRELFLIYKESINNLVKHSGCTEAEIELSFTNNALQLSLRDNGCGFDLAQASDGHGLVSMRARARSLGGTLDMDSQPGHGTSIKFSMPLNSHSPFAG